jgi:hypothetical protein
MMTWQEMINDPQLSNLDFKVETNEHGQIILTREVFLHGIYQSRIAEILKQLLPDGITSTETAIDSSKGTKIPDVIRIPFNHFIFAARILRSSRNPYLFLRPLGG